MSELPKAKDAAAMVLKAMQVQADRNLGSIHLEPQPLTDWDDREDHAPTTLQMDSRGRDRLIAALITGEASIEVYGASGGGYMLTKARRAIVVMRSPFLLLYFESFSPVLYYR